MRVWKRLCAVVIVCLFACAMLPAASADDSQELTDENGYTYCLSKSEKAIVVTGYTGTDTVLTLPHKIDGKPVTIISGFRADNAAEIQKVIIPNSVRIIKSSFNNFTSLEELNLPDSLFAICRETFIGCTSLRKVRLPLGLHVMDWCFRDCPDLRFEAYPLTYDRLPNEQKRIDVIPYSYTTGDLNADNQINTTDARLLLQAAVDKLTLSDEQASVADVNNDGVSDTTDARLVLQYAVGKSDGFKAEIMPDVPLIDPDDPDISVVQWKAGAWHPLAAPQKFLQTIESIISGPCLHTAQSMATAPYCVIIETETATIRLNLFIYGEDRNSGLELLYDGRCFVYTVNCNLLPYLT